MTTIRPSPPLRSADLGRIPGVSSELTQAESLELFRRICVSRAFELQAAKAYNMGAIKMPIYLSLGQEHIAAALSMVLQRPLIFAQHRAHSYYLSFGGDPAALIDELFHRPTGCAKGMGGSASIHDPRIGMFGHSGLMGDQVPIAVGACLASGKQTLSVVGDASGEEDYVYGAMGFAATKKLPFLLVCEDNDLSILTHVATRRSWSLADVARSLGMEAVDITDNPWLIVHHAKAILGRPAFINVRTCRELWHAGTGTDGPPEWDRLTLIQKEMAALGLEAQAGKIQAEAEAWAEREWQRLSPKP